MTKNAQTAMLFGDYRDTRHYFWYIQFEKNWRCNGVLNP